MPTADGADGSPEEQAAEDARRFRLLYEHMELAVCLVDLHGRVLEMNNAAARMSGYTQSELVSRSALALTATAEDQVRARDICRQAVRRGRTGKPVTLELPRKGGGWLWVRVEASLLRSANGRPHAILLTAQDISRGREARQREKRLVELLGSVRDLNRQLREMHERLELAVSGGELGAWDWRVPTGRMQCSDRCGRILGYGPGELQPSLELWRSLVHPDDRQRMNDTLEALLAGRTESFQLEHRLQRRTGEWVWVVSRGRATERDPEGRPLRVSGTLLDISERKRYEEELLLSRERYATYVRLTTDGIYRFELDEPIPTSLPVEEQVELGFDRAYLAEANDAYARMYGYSRGDELVGKRLVELFGGRDNPTNRAYLRQLVENGYRVEHALSREIDRDGRERYFRNTQFALVENGMVTRTWGTQHDVTELIQTQNALREREERLRHHARELTEQRRVTQKMFDTNPNVLYVFDVDLRRAVYRNRYLASSLGYSPRQINEMLPDAIFVLIHPADYPRFQNHIGAMHDAADGEIRSFEYRMRSADGAWRWFLSWDTPFERKEDGTVARIIGTAVDITDLKNAQADLEQYQHRLEMRNEQLSRMNRSLEQANRRLRELDKLKSDFVSVASHELRTPVTSVLAFTQILLSAAETISPQTRHTYLKTIESEARRLGVLAADLLDISRIESGRSELHLETASLPAIVVEVIDSLDIPPHRVVSLHTDEAGAQPLVCDPGRIRQVLGNLIENAVRYGTHIRVSVSGDAHERRVDVADNGPGIAPRDLERVFDKFYRVRGDKTPGKGSGLGLAIARDIVRAHGGSIWAESTVGEGSTFHFTLQAPPVEQEPAADTPRAMHTT